MCAHKHIEMFEINEVDEKNIWLEFLTMDGRMKKPDKASCFQQKKQTKIKTQIATTRIRLKAKNVIIHF